MAEHDHRAIAISTYNECWNLIESVRSADEDRNLLTLALTARYHWLKAGGPMEWAISDWMVSRCAAAIGDGQLSLNFAKSALAGVADDSPAWLQASMYEGMARAYAASGDQEAKVEHIALARKILDAEQSQEDRELIESQIATV